MEPRTKSDYATRAVEAAFSVLLEPLAKVFKPFMENSLVAEGLAKIRSRFLSPLHVGPVAVAGFLEISDPDERDIVALGVVGTVTQIRAWGAPLPARRRVALEDDARR
jgi:hypothetical protein